MSLSSTNKRAKLVVEKESDAQTISIQNRQMEQYSMISVHHMRQTSLDVQIIEVE
jgi:hypothetical protein